MNRLLFQSIVIATLTIGLSAFAEDPAGKEEGVKKGAERSRPMARYNRSKTPEQHRALAKIHSDAAACMESGKEAAECTAEFRKARREMMPNRRRGRKDKEKGERKWKKNKEQSKQRSE